MNHSRKVLVEVSEEHLVVHDMVVTISQSLVFDARILSFPKVLNNLMRRN